MVMRMRVALLVLLFALAPAATAGARGLTLGVGDGVFEGPDAGAWLGRAEFSGARIVRLFVSWRTVAPNRPADAELPTDPAYRWDPVDTAVDAAHARGLRVVIAFSSAPPWAEGPGRSRAAEPGSWKPAVSAVGDFAAAVARRYAGQAQYVQLWNEPNLDTYLAPQWVKRGGHYRSFAPGRYRAMLNAAYPRVHAAGMRLVTAGTAPFGDPGRGGRRIMPVRFWRAVLSKQALFDVLAHHPYGVGGPGRKALNADDVAVPDIHKLVAVVKAARRAGHVTASAARRFWVTEISWDSSPPDPDGVPARKHARWLADAFHILWRQGVETIVWFQIRDQAPDPDYASTNQSGLYLRSGRPKLAQRAFAFPLTCRRAGARVRVWMRAPHRGRVAVERRGKVLRRVRVPASRIVRTSVPASGPVRAVAGGDSSLSCRG
jgi:hypothetical protein